MKIRYIGRGSTRRVVLIGPYAIKIARIGIRYCLRRVVAIVRSGGTRPKLREWRDQRAGIAAVLVKAPFYGLIANLTEYRLCRRYPEAALADTLWSIGVVNVQRRAEPADTAELRSHPVVAALERDGGSPLLVEDVNRAQQFGLIDNRLQMLDYGNPLLAAWFSDHMVQHHSGRDGYRSQAISAALSTDSSSRLLAGQPPA